MDGRTSWFSDSADVVARNAIGPINIRTAMRYLRSSQGF
ncbi:hypothetical protein I553_9397 [Mycobacterium xenopi 4042]|uniref:Uncharacterized protein n=1 Tax=Mycobacterium xenopi 4042 TaxID=1299334 RepID=X8DZ33_MYCXE|nr:hypothetical protein I553_9397 [Mycobacterium xenopi 4042]